MSPKKYVFIEKARSDYGNYQQKARNFYHAMQNNLALEDWDGAASHAINTVIVLTSALTIFHAGREFRGDKHADAAGFLKPCMSHPEVDRYASQLAAILSDKSRIQYTGHLVTMKEATGLAKKVERFFHWAETLLPKT